DVPRAAVALTRATGVRLEIQALDGAAFYLVIGAGHAFLPYSFPTRRSSDLGCDVPPSNTVKDAWRDSSKTRPANALELKSIPKRSEEHTSELQSPYELVCRLLLEKNKRPPTTDHSA